MEPNVVFSLYHSTTNFLVRCTAFFILFCPSSWAYLWPVRRSKIGEYGCKLTVED